MCFAQGQVLAGNPSAQIAQRRGDNRRSAAGEFPAWLELTRMRNIEIFSRAAGSDSRLAAVARRYFEALSRLRRQLYELKRLPSCAAPPK